MNVFNKKNRFNRETGQDVSPSLKKKMLRHCFALGLIIAAYQMIPGLMFPIESLYVTGNISHLDEVELKRVVKKQIDAGFFSVNVAAVKSVVQELAWVQSVSVRRVWPDSLHIEITEHVAVAKWGDQQLINQSGYLFDAGSMGAERWASNNSVNLSNLPHISGPIDSYSELYAYYQDMQMVIEKAGLTVKSVDVDARRSMRVTLMNGVVLLLGRVDEESYDYQELTRFVSAYNKTLQYREADISEIDLRYTNGFAVRWKDQTIAQNTDVASLRL